MLMIVSRSLDRKDSEKVSPGTVLPRPQPTSARGNIAPWEQSPSPSDPSLQDTSGNVPSIQRQPPSTSPWTGAGDKPTMPTSVFGGSFYNDSTDNLGQISPGFAPSNGMGFPDDNIRRPSVTSASTMSSTGSKSSLSGRFHKKLGTFFGDEYTGLQDGSSRQNSETSSSQNLSASGPGGRGRDRNNSLNEVVKGSGPPSPSSSRPRTPVPSSEVTPWVYQDSQVRLFRSYCGIGPLH